MRCVGANHMGRNSEDAAIRLFKAQSSRCRKIDPCSPGHDYSAGQDNQHDLGYCAF